MKKTGLLLSAAALLVASCTNNKDSYVIKGTIPAAELNGKNVYLQELSEDGRSFNSVDTATIENGTFVFKGKAGEKPQIRFIAVADSPYRPALLILENGNIEINIDTVTKVKGSNMNDKYQTLADKLEAVNKKRTNVATEYNNAVQNETLTPESEDKFVDELEGINKEMMTLLFDYTKENISNPVGEFFFLTIVPNIEANEFKELIALTSPEFREKEIIKQVEARFKLEENSAVGQSFIDVKGLTPAGKEIALSDYAGKGKVVLIDFWASWCGPCIKEMPTVVEAYNKYRSKGFEIVGISLDDSKDKWVGAIKTLGMTWPQMSDLKGWGSELSAPYAVQSIPHTILLDKDGKVIAKDLRGAELLSKLEEVLK